MPLTVRRHKRTKRIRYDNKKKLKRKHVKTPKITLPIIKQAWDDKKSVKRNLTEMGLSVDANETIGRKRKRKQKKSQLIIKMDVSENLEREAKAPRVKNFKLPTPQVKYLTYLLNKYHDDYKAMARDPKNVYQETWKKIRHRIQQFKTLKQYQKFFSVKSTDIEMVTSQNNNVSVVESTCMEVDA